MPQSHFIPMLVWLRERLSVRVPTQGKSCTINKTSHQHHPPLHVPLPRSQAHLPPKLQHLPHNVSFVSQTIPLPLTLRPSPAQLWRSLPRPAGAGPGQAGTCPATLRPPTPCLAARLCPRLHPPPAPLQRAGPRPPRVWHRSHLPLNRHTGVAEAPRCTVEAPTASPGGGGRWWGSVDGRTSAAAGQVGHQPARVWGPVGGGSGCRQGGVGGSAAAAVRLLGNCAQAATSCQAPPESEGTGGVFELSCCMEPLMNDRGGGDRPWRSVTQDMKLWLHSCN